ncbi:MAG: hypothetical protein C5B55_03795 [Blastocatellia bacterium]|nr:MAG: hypothetical protein C5B55_03795 [Blastocatellia bacterium]
MNQEERKRQEKAFRVLCIWCGVKIRDDQSEDASGLCLKCFYQLLKEQLGTQKVSRYGEYVSER